MFIYIDEVGPASWLKGDIGPNEDEKQALEFKDQLRKGIHWTKNKEECQNMVDQMRACGKRAFENKKYPLAKNVYTCAASMSEDLRFPSENISILYQNIALCYLKMELPDIAFSYLGRATLCGFDNFKASILTIKALYMMYKFEEAMALVNFGLIFRPESEYIIELRKKLLTNKIPEKFSASVIEQRVSKFFKEPNTSSKPLAINLEPLLQHIQNNRRNESVEEAKKMMSQMFILIEYLMTARCFSEAHQILIDSYYLAHMLQVTYEEKVDEEKLFMIFVNKGTCLYYMMVHCYYHCQDEFEKALKCYERAKKYNLEIAETLTMEAKILLKLDKFDEATEKINRRIATVETNSVEALICEEVLFEINFQREAQDSPLNRGGTVSSESGSSNAASSRSTENFVRCDSKTGKKAPGGTQAKCSPVLDRKDKKVDLRDDNGDFLVKLCRLCGVVVSGPLGEHVRTEKHLKLMGRETQIKAGGETNRIDVATQTEDILYRIATHPGRNFPFTF